MLRRGADHRGVCDGFVAAEGLQRREVLTAGALSLFGFRLPNLIEARSAVAASEQQPASSLTSFGRAKSCILLFMWGGPAHQDTWDLKPDAPEQVRGSFRPIHTSVPGIEICEHFPLLAQRAHQLCVIRSMTHHDVNHLTSTHFLLTGQPPPQGNDIHNDWPHIGAVLSKLGKGTGPLPPFLSMRPKLKNDVPRFVEQSRGQFGGWLGASHNPMTIDANPAADDYHVGEFALPPEVSISRLDQRQRLLRDIERQRSRLAHAEDSSVMASHYRRAFELLHTSVGQESFDLSAEPAPLRERYGENAHGLAVLQSRRLVERGVPLVTVFWPNDGIKNVSVYWDTHNRNFVDLKERLMPVADQAFSALLDDLDDRGLLDETLVIWTGEFGRTPKVGQRNSDAGAGRDGRDHWPNCFTTVLAGAGIQTGQVYGSSDRHAALPASNAVHPVDLMATVYHALGIPPGLQLHDPLGRVLTLCPGNPISDILL